MSENRTLSLLQTSSQALVVAAGLVYLFGFVIVSIFDGTYGIADFAFFRTKLIAVGSLFVFMVALPMLTTMRMFAWLGLTFKHVATLPQEVPVEPRYEGLRRFDAALSLPFVFFGFLWPASFLFTHTGVGLSSKGIAAFFVMLVAEVISGILSRKGFNRHPFLFVGASVLITAAMFVNLFFCANRVIFWTVVWFSLVSVFTIQTSFILKGKELRRTEWERLLLTVVPAIFGLYATKIYPSIVHQYGGGTPVPIVLHMTKKLAPFDSDSISVSLIDETEQGYYVIRGTDKAIFVSRVLVEGVEFLRFGQVSQTPQSPNVSNFR